MENKTISRRSFLKVSSLASSGLIIGFGALGCSQIKKKVNIEDLDFTNFNGFIEIASNNTVIIYSKNPEIGQGVKTAMPMIIAEELDINWDNIVVKQAHLNPKVYGKQAAVGSTSIRSNWDDLRNIGASIKQLFINAAAKHWQVSTDELTTSEGYVIKGNKKISYGELIDIAETLDIPTEFQLKKVSDFKIIGTAKDNVDNQKIVTGKPLFGLDYKVEGMLYASMIRPPFGKKLLGFENNNTIGENGIVDVFKLGNRIAIIANSTWQAIKGSKNITAKWADKTVESSEIIEPKMLDLLESGTFNTIIKDGDIRNSFKSADEVISSVYETPFLAHNCMEPMNFFAHVTPEAIKLAGPIQIPQNAVNRIARVLKRDKSDISLELTRIGGGFGRRLFNDYALDAAEVSNKIQKPVKLIYTREDDIKAGMYKPANKYKFSASIKNNKVTGFGIKEVGVGKTINAGYHGMNFPKGVFENYQIDTHKYKSKISTAAWRSPIGNFLAFAEQSFIDELSDKLGQDTIQLRLDWLKQSKETSFEKNYDADRYINTINKVIEITDYHHPKPNTFYGFASYYSHHTYAAHVAEITMENKIPVVKKITCAIDCGIVVNPSGAKNQIEGSIIDGLGHATYSELTIKDGTPQSTNFHNYRLIRMNETPQVEVHFIKNDIAPTGLGEPGLPPTAPAVANAIKKATGIRITQLPFIKNTEIYGS